MESISDIVNRCISFGEEKEWFEFKDNLYKPDDIGEYISALSNAALMAGEPFGYLIWGIHDSTHEYTNTKFNYQKDHNGEPFQHYCSGQAELAAAVLAADAGDGNALAHTRKTSEGNRE